MDEALITEIDDIKTRLAEISEQREDLAEDAGSRRDELLAEEHRLESRLTELEDEVVEEDTGVAEKGVSEQTDLTRPPKLPEEPEE